MKQCIAMQEKTATLIVIMVFVSMVGLMLACATDPAWTRAKSFTPQDLAKDKYACMQEAQQDRSSSTGAYHTGVYYQPGTAKSGAVMNKQLFNTCMEARGWNMVKERR